MHVVNAFPNGNFEVLDTYSKGYLAPKIDSSVGGKYDIKDIKKVTDSGDFIEITYTRDINTNDKYDYVIKTVRNI